MLVRLFEDNPNDREIRKIVELLRNGGVIIYPTDTIYAIGCDSVKVTEGEVEEYITDPELIHEKYNRLVDLVIDGGYGNNIPSTVIDCTGDEIVVTRQGLGEL